MAARVRVSDTYFRINRRKFSVGPTQNVFVPFFSFFLLLQWFLHKTRQRGPPTTITECGVRACIHELPDRQEAVCVCVSRYNNANRCYSIVTCLARTVKR